MNLDQEDIWETEDYSPSTLATLPSAIFFPDSITRQHAGLRLDQALANLMPEYSRSRLQSWIRAGQVRLDQTVCTEPKYRLRGIEHLHIEPTVDSRDLPFLPEDIRLDIVFEDDEILVINKPAGLVVHPGSGNWSGTVLNALLHHRPGLAALPRAGIVHRLDKDTSGLIVVAATLTAQTALVRQLQARTVGRRYLALVCGQTENAGFVDAPIARHPRSKTRMAVVTGGKPALTHYRVIERLFHDTLGSTLLECRLETGRTHQIRVHMSHIGHPLVGDVLYAGHLQARCRHLFHRQALLARRLELIHPRSGEAMAWQVPLPDDFSLLLDTLRRTASERRTPDSVDSIYSSDDCEWRNNDN